MLNSFTVGVLPGRQKKRLEEDSDRSDLDHRGEAGGAMDLMIGRSLGGSFGGGVR